MNEIVNTFLLARDKPMPEMHLRQARFTYSVCGPLTKNKERIQELQDIFSKMNQVKLVFNMIWLMKMVKI